MAGCGNLWVEEPWVADPDSEVRKLRFCHNRGWKRVLRKRNPGEPFCMDALPGIIPIPASMMTIWWKEQCGSIRRMSPIVV